MKLMNKLLLASMVSASYQAGAAIIAEHGMPGELYVVVSRASNGATFFADLGLTADRFLTPQAGDCVKGNFTQDANYKDFLAAPASDLKYVVVGINPNDAQNNDWGFMSTSSAQAAIFNTTPVGVDRTLQAIQGEAVALNGNEPYDKSKHQSGVVPANGNKYASFNSPFFGPRINNTLTGDATGTPTANPQFFFVSGKSSTATLLGTWNLSSGVLSFTSSSGKGVTAICGGTPTPTPTPTPNVTVSASPSTQEVGKAIKITVSSKDPSKGVDLAFAKNGTSFAPIKALKKGVKSFSWKPKAADVTAAGVIRACEQGTTSNCGTTKVVVTAKKK